MTALRAFLRNGLFGIVLAYAMAVQAMLAGPLLAAPSTSLSHEICLTGEPAPDGTPHHGGHDCPCLVPGMHHGSFAMLEQAAFLLPMRAAVPLAYSAAEQISPFGSGPESPAARGPPAVLV